MIEESIQARLQGFPGLAALIGDKVFPGHVPEGKALPAVTFTKTSGQRGQIGDGPTGDAFPDFQISCWAKTYSVAKAVANQVRLALDGFEGDMNGTAVYDCELFNEIDMYDPDTKSEGVALFFTIRHQEEVPTL
jgi:hypothetical protein